MNESNVLVCDREYVRYNLEEGLFMFVIIYLVRNLILVGFNLILRWTQFRNVDSNNQGEDT